MIQQYQPSHGKATKRWLPILNFLRPHYSLDLRSGQDTACDPTLCAENEFVQNHTCFACPLYTANPAGDSAVGSDTSCSPVLCAEDHRVDDHACVACLSGLTNVAGDPISGADTQCDNFACVDPIGGLLVRTRLSGASSQQV